jgi:hypothetical protein
MLRYNNLNKIKGITAMLLLMAVGYSCNDLVDEIPISEISPEGFYKTNDDIEDALMGVYDALQGTYRENTFNWGELRSDNHQPFSLTSASLNRVEVVNNAITQGNPAARWNDLYRMIDRANQIIVNAPNVTGLNNNFLAETLALRAKAYFDAVRVWGDVPLFVEPVSTPEEATQTVTDGETILNTVVIPDMIQAQELMDIPTSDYRFSKASIYALQAEVYMWIKDYPKAKEALDEFFLLGGHSLVTTPEAWQDLFYNSPPVPDVPDGRGKIQTGPELILSIRYDLTEDENYGGRRNNRSGIMGLYYAGIPSYVFSEEIENKWREKFPIVDTLWTEKYPDTDPALTRTVLVDDGMGGQVEEEEFIYGDWRYFYSRAGGAEGVFSLTIGFARTAKWNKTNYGSVFDDTDIVLYRYADMILLLAEAENQINADGGRALDLVNQIRTARQLPLVGDAEFGTTKEERLDYILDERQLELFGEGKRWWDLVRNDKAIEVLNPILSEREATVQLTEDRLLWPIFDIHLIENTLLQQNPGYTN